MSIPAAIETVKGIDLAQRKMQPGWAPPEPVPFGETVGFEWIQKFGYPDGKGWIREGMEDGTYMLRRGGEWMQPRTGSTP